MRTRKCTPSTASEYLVAIPTVATIHIQKIAPGPPMRMAVATPPMLPLPTVAASAVESAWKDEIVPSLPPFENIPPSDIFTEVPKRRTCTKPVR